MKLAHLLAGLMLAVGAVPAAAAAQAPAVAVDWAQRVERTPDGYRMGNPDAPLKLVEYGSVTCSHCADFEAAAGDEIRDHVRTGRVSFEYRPFVIFPSDPGIFMLLDCQAPDKFFATVHALYATQASWVAKLEPQMDRLYAEMERRPYREVLPAIVRATGVDRLFQEQGLTEQQVATCLTSPAAHRHLDTIHQRAQRLGVEGTPTFFLNGQKIEIASWDDVLVRLRQP